MKVVTLLLLILVGWAMIGMLFAVFVSVTSDTSFTNISGGLPDWESGMIKLAPMAGFFLLFIAGWKILQDKDKGDQ